MVSGTFLIISLIKTFSNNERLKLKFKPKELL